jgi:hypothetical protein
MQLSFQKTGRQARVTGRKYFGVKRLRKRRITAMRANNSLATACAAGFMRALGKAGRLAGITFRDEL